MNPHDIRKRTDLSHEAVQLECNCGWKGIGAEEKHQRHYANATVHGPGLAASRAALRGRGDDAA